MTSPASPAGRNTPAVVCILQHSCSSFHQTCETDLQKAEAHKACLNQGPRDDGILKPRVGVSSESAPIPASRDRVGKGNHLCCGIIVRLCVRRLDDTRNLFPLAALVSAYSVPGPGAGHCW